MRERPILFSAPMVRAILEGRKTATRRVVKPQPMEALYLTHSGFSAWHDEKGRPLRNRYGQPGDWLWVREAFAINEIDALLKGCWYRATQDDFVASLPETLRENAAPPGGKWKSSIHMPRWASRITLEVTGLRVERLHDITEDDAAREGVLPLVEPDGSVLCGRRKTAFRGLWDAINGPDSWDANPWVWVIEFKRVTP